MAALQISIALDMNSFKLRVEFGKDIKRLAVVGPNGAGKTTLLHCLLGLHQPSEATIRFGNKTFLETGAGLFVPLEERDIGYLPQTSCLFPHMTVLENLAFALDGRAGRRRRLHRERATETLESWHVGHLSARYPAELSGGERQRVALARALVTRPSLLVLDEPFSALDREARGPVRTQLASHVATSGCAMVIVTHDAKDVMALADAMICLDRGRIVDEGIPTEVRRRSDHPFLEEFFASLPS